MQALGTRLEEMLQKDKQHIPDIVSMVTEENRQKELFIEDEEEDFLDEGKESLPNQPYFGLKVRLCMILNFHVYLSSEC